MRFPEFSDSYHESTLGEIFEYERPDNYIVSSEKYSDSFPIPVLTANQAFVLGYTNETTGIYDKGPVILFDDFTCDMKYADFPFKVKSSAMKLLTPKEGIPIFYAYNLLQHINYKPEGHARHWISIMQPIKVSLPCHIEQKRISEFLSLVCKRIEKHQMLIAALKKYKRGAINNIFNGYTFDKSVKECLLSDVASFHQGLTYSPEDVSDTGYLVLRSSNIQNGRLSFKDNVYVKKSISESLFVQKNDVLMCVRNGSKQLVGKTAIVNRPYPNMTWGAFMMIIRSALKNTFVYHYLNSDYFFNQVFKDSGTATINQITKGTLNECRLFLPNPEQQERICQYLDLLDGKLQKEEDYLESLKALKQSLLQHLFI